MKKLLIAFALVAMGAGAFAQANKSKSKTQAKPVSKEAAASQAAVVAPAAISTDFYTRVGGEVFLMKGGQRNGLENESVRFENGNYLTREGVLVFNNNTEKMMLEEGMRVDLKGNLIDRSKEVATPEMQDMKQLEVAPEK